MTVGFGINSVVEAGDLLPLSGIHLLDQVTCLLKPFSP